MLKADRWEAFAVPAAVAVPPVPRSAFTFDDGRICLPNNAAARALRGIALGGKSWLFVRSERGGVRAAFMYSLIVTARMNDIDPQGMARRYSRPPVRHDSLACPGRAPMDVAIGANITQGRLAAAHPWMPTSSLPGLVMLVCRLSVCNLRPPLPAVAVHRDPPGERCPGRSGGSEPVS